MIFFKTKKLQIDILFNVIKIGGFEFWIIVNKISLPLIKDISSDFNNSNDFTCREIKIIYTDYFLLLQRIYILTY